MGLRKLHRGKKKQASWTDLERIYGVKYQTLQNWCKGSREHQQLFDFIEKARRDLKIDEAAAYKKTVKSAVKTGITGEIEPPDKL